MKIVEELKTVKEVKIVKEVKKKVKEVKIVKKSENSSKKWLEAIAHDVSPVAMFLHAIASSSSYPCG